MTWLSAVWRWLMTSQSEMQMSRYWLADKARIAEYAAWTELQREGMVVRDSAWFQREAFWQAHAEQSEARRLKVVGGRFQ